MDCTSNAYASVPHDKCASMVCGGYFFRPCCLCLSWWHFCLKGGVNHNTANSPEDLAKITPLPSRTRIWWNWEGSWVNRKLFPKNSKRREGGKLKVTGRGSVLFLQRLKPMNESLITLGTILTVFVSFFLKRNVNLLHLGGTHLISTREQKKCSDSTVREKNVYLRFLLFVALKRRFYLPCEWNAKYLWTFENLIFSFKNRAIVCAV